MYRTGLNLGGCEGGFIALVYIDGIKAFNTFRFLDSSYFLYEGFR